ncbi:DUF2330 domain-containing protein [Streptomyces sp. NPDC046716]|uniref:DUF2330 domain-containing protein n=1 Tax=Streptomyces sp. NPDC046716 TaxID=3157093 RepID=UPI0033FBC23A
MTRTRARALLTALLLIGIQVTWIAVPAYACGCGAMIPRTGHQVTVTAETSAIAWDGRTEQIVMRLSLTGDSKDAAWIMPVPHRATAELGDPALFSALTEETAPAHRTRHHFWPRGDDWPFGGDTDTSGDAALPGATADPGVHVVGRQRLGPFDVARLTATDPTALADWLKDNGFKLPARLENALRPYVDQGWEYVAIRLAPADDAKPLAGQLDPLHLTFASDRLVYPMRLSQLAASAQHLNLYVLAAHRMEPRSAIGGSTPKVTFAGDLGTLPPGPLAELAGDTRYLTAIDQDFWRPQEIGGDHELRRAAHDTPYREVVYKDELLTVGPDLPVWLLTVLGALTAGVSAALLRARAHRRRPIVPPPPVTVPPPLGRP